VTGPLTGLRVPVGALGVREELGTGGQGRVYLIANDVLRRPYPLVYKEYNAESRGRLEVQALEAMVGAPLAADLVDRLAWPLALVERGGDVCGFLMRRIPRPFYMQMRLLRQDRFVPGEVQHFLTDDGILTKRRLPINDRWRLAFLRDTAETIDRLHRLDIAVGDLSPKNLLISLTERPSCFFIDCDAMRVGSRSVLPQVETTSWQLPTADETTGTAGSDAFKFGLLAIRLAAGDLDTLDPAALRRIAPDLGWLAERALATDPAQRPGFDEWLTALDAAMPGASVRLSWQTFAGAPLPVTVPRPMSPPGPPATRPAAAFTPPPLAAQQLARPTAHPLPSMPQPSPTGANANQILIATLIGLGLLIFVCIIIGVALSPG